MSDSIIVTNHREERDLRKNITGFYEHSRSEQYSIGRYQIAIRYRETKKSSEIYAANESLSAFLIGEITNSDFIRRMLLPFNNHSLVCSNSELVLMLYQYIGYNAFQLLDGYYTIVIINKDDSCEIFSDFLGALPLYYCFDKEESFWASNEVKTLFGIEGINFKLKPLGDRYAQSFTMEDYSIFQKISKLPPSCRLKFNDLNSDPYKVILKPYGTNNYGTELSLSEDKAIELLDQILTISITERINNNTSLAIPLSGGLDSSLVASISAKQVENLFTIAMGTEAGNEFKFAKIVSDFVGSSHQEIIFSEEDILKGIVQSIFFNEVYDSLCIEVQMPFYYLYKQIKNYANTVLTGYGADMLFAGHLPLDADLQLVNKKLKFFMNRNKRRGEYIPYVAQKMNLTVHHPFCSNNMIAFSIDLAAKLKISNGHVKYVLRKLASKKQYLPEEICYRKKIALEIASSINDIFSRYLGLDTPYSYKDKDVFTYNIFKSLFEKQIPVERIDVEEYRAMFFKHELQGS